MEDKVLVKKAKGGDKAAFCELVKQRKEMLYKLAYMYVKNEHDAVEIVDETVYRAYISIAQLKNDEYFTTWFTRILINCALGHIKKSKKIVFFDNGMEYKDDREALSSEEIIDLYDAVDKLEGKYKTVVILKYFNDMTIKEIAEVMNCKESSIKNYLHKALLNLRINLGEECVNVWTIKQIKGEV